LLVVLFGILLGARGLARADEPGDHAPPPSAHAAPQANAAEHTVDPDLDVELEGAPPASDAKAYGAFLRAALAKARPRVVGKLEEKMIAGQENSCSSAVSASARWCSS
jgi:hypothetical protein